MNEDLERNKRILWDVNGVTLKLKPEGKALWVSESISSQYLTHLEAIRNNASDRPLLDRLKDALDFPDVKHRTNRWKILDGESPERYSHYQELLDSNRHIDQGLRLVLWSVYERNYTQYFEDYIPLLETDTQLEVMQTLKDEGYKNTLLSSIPYQARWTFVDQLCPVWPYLDTSISAIQRPDERSSGIFLKVAVPVILGAEEDITVIDDDPYIGRCIAGATGRRVFIIGSRQQSLSLPHLEKLNNPFEKDYTDYIDNKLLFFVGSVDELPNYFLKSKELAS
jgi:hypothetical protein